jgi:endonuclease/exonuclease/phosphatase family metal-dependent hydrolase
MVLRIASYNIHKSKGSDGRFDPGRVIDVINALGADVLALQEVDFRFRGRPSALPLAELREGCALVPVDLTPTGPESLGWHGQTLLLRKGITLSGLRALPLPGFEPRGALIADLDAGSGPLRLAGVHLGLRRANRRAQLAHIRAALREGTATPALIIGDFNEWAETKGLEALHGFHLHTPGPSYPARAPFGRLDRVAAGPGLSVLRAGVFDSGLARRASDHLPIWADVRIER